MKIGLEACGASLQGVNPSVSIAKSLALCYD